MDFISTHALTGTAPAHVRISTALKHGPAPDGGLYVPTFFPRFCTADFSDICPTDPDGLLTASGLARIAERLLLPFFTGDPLAHQLGSICRATYTFDTPIRRLPDTPGRPPRSTSVLELFHGPTAAAADLGVRFVAEALAALWRMEAARAADVPAATHTVLVATAGNTGAACIEAFAGHPRAQVVVLYPHAAVSAPQRMELCAPRPGVTAYAVQGTFDDCQRMVTEAFADPALLAAQRLVSANSTNVGRILAQMVYAAASALRHERRTGEPLSLVVPTGNLSNAVAALWAQQCGLPIDSVALALNANQMLADYLDSGMATPKPSVRTRAPGMDVGAPRNLPRLDALFADLGGMREAVFALSVDDAHIAQTMARVEGICPHTACGLVVRDMVPTRHALVYGTAHPAKYPALEHAQEQGRVAHLTAPGVLMPHVHLRDVLCGLPEAKQPAEAQ